MIATFASPQILFTTACHVQFSLYKLVCFWPHSHAEGEKPGNEAGVWFFSSLQFEYKASTYTLVYTCTFTCTHTNVYIHTCTHTHVHNIQPSMTVKRRRGIGCSRTIPSNDLRASRWEVTFGCSTIFDLTHDHNQLKMLCSKHLRSAIACYFYFYTLCCMYPLQMLVLCRLCQWLGTGLVCVK